MDNPVDARKEVTSFDIELETRFTHRPRNDETPDGAALASPPQDTNTTLTEGRDVSGVTNGACDGLMSVSENTMNSNGDCSRVDHASDDNPIQGKSEEVEHNL